MLNQKLLERQIKLVDIKQGQQIVHFPPFSGIVPIK